MSILTPFAQFIRQALKYPLFSPFLPPPEKVEKDFSYSAGQLIGTFECPPGQGLPKTGQEIEYYPGDDGTYQKGYPLVPPRFIDNNDGTITDKATGLIWQKDGSHQAANWEDAIDYAEGLNLGGKTDWRLPNLKELLSIVNYGAFGPAIDEPPFENTVSISYWTSTSYFDYTDNAWVINFVDGDVYYLEKTNAWGWVRCVRG